MGALEKLLNRMKDKRVYFDSNFLIYFLEHHEPQFSAVLPLIQACDAGLIQGMTGEAAVAEVMVLPYRKADAIAIATTKSFLPVRISFRCYNTIRLASIQHQHSAQVPA